MLSLEEWLEELDNTTYALLGNTDLLEGREDFLQDLYESGVSTRSALETLYAEDEDADSY